MAPITLFSLQASRSIRTAWLLEELGVDYIIESSSREGNGDTSANYRQTIPAGRSPAIIDGDLVLLESAAIAEYLCERYDTNHKLMPADIAARSKFRMWMSACEGTFLVHAFTILYGSGAAPEAADKLQATLSRQVHRDFDWLESELSSGQGKFLVGDNVTAADTMMVFTVAIIFKMGLGTKGKRWPAVEAWLKNIESTPGFKRAAQKIGYTL